MTRVDLVVGIGAGLVALVIAGVAFLVYCAIVAAGRADRCIEAEYRRVAGRGPVLVLDNRAGTYTPEDPPRPYYPQTDGLAYLEEALRRQAEALQLETVRPPARPPIRHAYIPLPSSPPDVRLAAIRALVACTDTTTCAGHRADCAGACCATCPSL